ncbi:MarR family transcriptional regulator [Pendulispora brunnea]|uniref:MarR family transcriptional regulator n=1 Tax=Pendulispora brunnea TaxID=2905690 RepID=A0ABZ2KLQ3_9BACT
MASKGTEPSIKEIPASGVTGTTGVTRKNWSRTIGEELGRELSARTILFHQAIAERMGISVTDHKCLDIAGRAALEGPLTAGRMAELTGLTTGAITGVLDRLEKAGFVRREKDPDDRRQVLVRILPDRTAEYISIFGPFAKAWEEMCSRYTEEELARVHDFFRTSLELIRQETERVRAMGPASPAGGPNPPPQGTTELSAPLTHDKVGYLEFVRGCTNMQLHAEVGPHLYRGRFVGAEPRITAHEGHIVVEPSRSMLRGLTSKRGTSELAIHPSLPWHILVRGGVVNLDADLRALTLRELEISGGAVDVSLQLPRPADTVIVRIRGGVKKVTLLRPEGVPTRLVVKSGASGLTIDTLHLGAVGGKTDWASPDFANAKARYDIEVLGGADRLTLGTLPPVTYTRSE